LGVNRFIKKGAKMPNSLLSPYLVLALALTILMHYHTSAQNNVPLA